jgi:hypothetical protein
MLFDSICYFISFSISIAHVMTFRLQEVTYITDRMSSFFGNTKANGICTK